jgi:uncharacterized protein YkwD
MRNSLLYGAMLGSALVVLLTTLFAFAPNSADQSSIPILKAYLLKIINQQRQKTSLTLLKQGEGIAAQNQANFILAQTTITHLDYYKNSPMQRYFLSGERGYVAENLSLYHCSDDVSCKIALSTAIEEMTTDREANLNILNPGINHVSLGIAVGKGKVALVLDFEKK